MNEKIGKILSKMTLEEKISLCNGADFWHSKAMEQYGIPAITMSDTATSSSPASSAI